MFPFHSFILLVLQRERERRNNSVHFGCSSPIHLSLSCTFHIQHSIVFTEFKYVAVHCSLMLAASIFVFALSPLRSLSPHHRQTEYGRGTRVPLSPFIRLSDFDSHCHDFIVHQHNCTSRMPRKISTLPVNCLVSGTFNFLLSLLSLSLSLSVRIHLQIYTSTAPSSYS